MIKKKLLLFTAFILLCGCGNIETDTANEVVQGIPEAPTLPNSTYLDTSDLTYTGDYTMKMLNGFELEGDANQTLTLYFDGYESKNGEIFAFDEHNRLRFYSLEQYEEQIETVLSEEQMRQICDEVLTEFIPNYDKYEYLSSYYTKDSIIPYELMMSYKTDSVSYGAVISLNPSGTVSHMNISYYDIPDESQIDHEYFDTKFEEYVANVKANGDIHHYTLDNEYYYLRDNSVYALYSVTFYDNPISEDSEEYPAFCESFGFAKSLE